MSSCHPDKTPDTIILYPKQILIYKPQFDSQIAGSNTFPPIQHQIITWDRNAVHNIIGEWSSDNDKAEAAIIHTNDRSTQQGLGYFFGFRL